MKIAMVDGHLENRWISCSTITKNIKKTYHANDFEIKSFSIDAKREKINFSTYKVAKQVSEYCPDVIALVDYQPVPDFFINCIFERYKDIENKPKIVFHIYGDFTIFLNKWIRCNDTLKHFECKFLAASEAQTNLLRKFISDGDKLVGYHPFPVDTEFFKFDTGLINQAKKRFNIDEDEYVFVYTGRLTLQKNTLKLIKCAKLLSNFSKKKLKILLAGPFDDIGYKYFGYYIDSGEYQSIWNKSLDSLDKNTREKIVHLGLLDRDDLKLLYHAGDSFISMSTHNDEDFGMSPAEAFCCGMDGLLTKWGGLKSFNLDDRIDYVPTKFSRNKGGKIDESVMFKKALSKIRKKSKTSEEKNEISRKFHRFFSVESLSSKLLKILDEDFHKFNGFDDKAFEVAKRLKLCPQEPFINKKVTIIKESDGESNREFIQFDNSTISELLQKVILQRYLK
jgi:glycosyltransferase involved in cell wall biosynthesis